MTVPDGKNRDRRNDLLVIRDNGNSFRIIPPVTVLFISDLYLFMVAFTSAARLTYLVCPRMKEILQQM